jgi:cell division protein ZapA (FtsZ GTPase activity inhibitor)
MSEQTVKINIADRDYTLRVEAAEAPFFRLAAERLNDRLRQKRVSMRVPDKQDLLAMVAFDVVFEELTGEEFAGILADRLANLEKLIPENLPMAVPPAG